MTDKWSSGDIIYFLETYKKYEILWNPKCEHYRDRSARNFEFNKLLQELSLYIPNIDIGLIKNKIRTIKTVLGQELKKIARFQKSTNSTYTPKLSWFSAAYYLHDCARRREAIKMPSGKVSTAKAEWRNLDSEVDEPPESTGRKKNTEPAPESIGRKKKTEPEMPPKKKPKTHEIYNKVEFLSNSELSESACSEPQHSAESKDELSLFGNYVSAQLRKLPEVNALRCQNKIFEIMYAERMSLITQDPLGCEVIGPSPTTSISSCPSLENKSSEDDDLKRI